MLLAPSAIDAVLQTGLVGSEFYRDTHGLLYRVMVDMHRGGAAVDGITLTDELERRGKLKDLPDGPATVHELAALVPAAANAAHYARIVRATARRRALYLAAMRLQTAALDGSDLDDATRQLRDLADTPDWLQHRQPLAVMTADVFLDQADEHAPALIGTDDDAILTTGGFLLMAGEGGASKTTLTLDALVHLAAGEPWLDIPIARPVRVLLIENEGPRPRFRQKLQEKLDAWDGPDVSANMLVSAEPWGRFSFADDGLRNELRAVCRDEAIDLVFADPVGSLGVEGVGAPDETARFMEHLKSAGLFDPDDPVAYWLLHHFNKSQAKSVLQQLSGAWGGHPDAVLGVAHAGEHRTKLTWAKLRWATPPKDDVEWLLGWTDGRSFARIEKTDSPVVSDEDLVARITEVLLAAGADGLGVTKVRSAVKGDNARIEMLLKSHDAFHALPKGKRVVYTLEPQPSQDTFLGEPI
jgi:hypothetical protein